MPWVQEEGLWTTRPYVSEVLIIAGLGGVFMSSRASDTG